MSYHRISAASPPVKVGNVNFNLDATLSATHHAHTLGASVVVFPELGLTGYSSGDLFAQTKLIQSANEALIRLAKETEMLPISVIVGFPFAFLGRLYNCGAILASGKIKGIVPKQFLPNSGEYYEQRWFTSALGMQNISVDFYGESVNFGPNQVFVDSRTSLVIGIELCEDLWAVTPPSNQLCLAGANLILNLSASNEVLGKESYRRELVQQQSARTLCAYAYASAGPGESSTDVVYSGHCMIAENGVLLAESERFKLEGSMVIADIDLERIDHDRRINSSFSSKTAPSVERVSIQLSEFNNSSDLLRPNPKHPFVPADNFKRQTVCQEIFSIQTTGLMKRLTHTGIQRVIIGVSGGLDSSLALLVAVSAFDRLQLPRCDILAVTLPGFGTTTRTEANATSLSKSLGVEFLRIDITKSVTQHLVDIQHPFNTHDVTYENAQARERTQILMDLANQRGGLVVGTGDLSEAALGWCTFNGDHMSMYHVNIGVPKTLVKYLLQWCSENDYKGSPGNVLADIIETPISPELLPKNKIGEQPQKTEETIGPYELHDFFLYHFVRFGASPSKVVFLAEKAFVSEYSRNMIIHWLRVFYQRFFAQQFKRSSMPDGPKVGSVALSPRGDWRMPSDADASLWLKELDSL